MGNINWMQVLIAFALGVLLATQAKALVGNVKGKAGL